MLSQVPSDWGRSDCEVPSSGPFTDVLFGLSLDFGWPTQRLSWNHSSIVLAVCFRWLWCSEVNRHHRLWSCALWSRFSWGTSLYLAAFILKTLSRQVLFSYLSVLKITEYWVHLPQQSISKWLKFQVSTSHLWSQNHCLHEHISNSELGWTYDKYTTWN